MRLFTVFAYLAALLESKQSAITTRTDVLNLNYKKDVFDAKYDTKRSQSLRRVDFKIQMIKTVDPSTEIYPNHITKSEKQRQEDSTSNGNLNNEYIQYALNNESLKLKNQSENHLISRRHFICALTKPADLWMHCQDLITPFIKGIRKNITITRLLRVDNKGREVLRLLNLIKLRDIEKEDPAEIRAYLMRIAESKIRLYQWAFNAIRILLDAIIKDHNHTFRNLKSSIKELLKSWRMDYSDTAQLLNYTTIFKPMCITYVHFEGGTTPLRGKGYTKPKPPTTPLKCPNNVCMQDPDIKRKRIKKRKHLLY